MILNTDQVWQSALGQLQLQMTRATYDTWLKETHIISHQQDRLVIGTKSSFAKDWLENRLSNTISRTVANILGHQVDIKFVVDAADEPEQGKQSRQQDGKHDTQHVDQRPGQLSLLGGGCGVDHGLLWADGL